MLRFETTLGAFSVELFEREAPETVANFLKYADDGFYDGPLFHRIVPEFLGLDDHRAFGIIASIALGIVSSIGAMFLQRMIFAGLGRRASLSASGA